MLRAAAATKATATTATARTNGAGENTWIGGSHRWCLGYGHQKVSVAAQNAGHEEQKGLLDALLQHQFSFPLSNIAIQTVCGVIANGLGILQFGERLAK